MTTAPDARNVSRSRLAPRPSRTVTTPPGLLSLASLWSAMKILLIAGGIAALVANLLGVWQTAGQIEARAKREAWQAQLKKWDDEQRQLKEDMDKTNKEWEEFWRRNQF